MPQCLVTGCVCGYTVLCRSNYIQNMLLWGAQSFCVYVFITFINCLCFVFGRKQCTGGYLPPYVVPRFKNKPTTHTAVRDTVYYNRQGEQFILRRNDIYLHLVWDMSPLTAHASKYTLKVGDTLPTSHQRKANIIPLPAVVRLTLRHMLFGGAQSFYVMGIPLSHHTLLVVVISVTTSSRSMFPEVLVTRCPAHHTCNATYCSTQNALHTCCLGVRSLFMCGGVLYLVLPLLFCFVLKTKQPR